MVAHYLPIDITWVDNKRLVMGVGRGNRLLPKRPSATGDIIAVDIDGKNKRVLYSDTLAQLDATRERNVLLKIPHRLRFSISGTPDQRQRLIFT